MIIKWRRALLAALPALVLLLLDKDVHPWAFYPALALVVFLVTPVVFGAARATYWLLR